jgi:hypothetical protein
LPIWDAKKARGGLLAQEIPVQRHATVGRTPDEIKDAVDATNLGATAAAKTYVASKGAIGRPKGE